MFYVGNQGNYDSLVVKLLEELKSEYSHIEYLIVLAYMPSNKLHSVTIDFAKTIFPEAVASVYPKFAIDKRNRWMIDKSQYVVTYVRRVGGAAKYKELAAKKGKTVIELSEYGN